MFHGYYFNTEPIELSPLLQLNLTISYLQIS